MQATEERFRLNTKGTSRPSARPVQPNAWIFSLRRHYPDQVKGLQAGQPALSRMLSAPLFVLFSIAESGGKVKRRLNFVEIYKIFITFFGKPLDLEWDS